MEISSITDLGLIRSNNEDYHICDSAHGLVVIADGVGGDDYGEVASKIAVESCYQYLTNEYYLEDTTNISETLLDSMVFANQQVIHHKKDKPEYKNMGTTLSCLYLKKNELTYSWIGDSRIYVVSQAESTINLLTEDHSLYNEMVRRGEVAAISTKNILTRTIGNNLYTQPDVGEYSLKQGDIILACTDGLSDLLPDDILLQTVMTHADNLDQALTVLVDLAKGQGGRDNITVALMRNRL